MLENETISTADETAQNSAPEVQAAEIAAADETIIPAKEEATMLDVHPPHEPIHTWKEYLLHMSTIVLGLLIAIGLEQSVEAIHRAHERQELRESLRRETERAIADAKQTEEIENDPLRWLTARQQLVQKALASHQPLPARLPRKPHVFSSHRPIDPAWGAARSSGLLSLLSQEEVEVYSEADLLFTNLEEPGKVGIAASYKRAEFEFRYSLDAQDPQSLDLSHATNEELNTYLNLLQEEYSAWDQVRVGCEYLRGIETAILGGSRDLGEIEAASRRFYSPNPQ